MTGSPIRTTWVDGGLFGCLAPGDFAWMVATERNEKGVAVKTRPFDEKSDDRPTHIWLVDPNKQYVRLPLNPEPNGWRWDDDLHFPSLIPSIFNNPPDGWHGFLKNGELIKA